MNKDKIISILNRKLHDHVIPEVIEDIASCIDSLYSGGVSEKDIQTLKDAFENTGIEPIYPESDYDKRQSSHPTPEMPEWNKMSPNSALPGFEHLPDDAEDSGIATDHTVIKRAKLISDKMAEDVFYKHGVSMVHSLEREYSLGDFKAALNELNE